VRAAPALLLALARLLPGRARRAGGKRRPGILPRLLGGGPARGITAGAAALALLAARPAHAEDPAEGPREAPVVVAWRPIDEAAMRMGLLDPREWEQAVRAQGLVPVGAPAEYEIWTDVPVRAVRPAAPPPSGGPRAPAVGVAVPPDYAGMIAAAAQRWGLPAAAMVAVARCESGLRPGAVGPFRERGLFQFVAGTWASVRRAMGLSPDYAAAFDPAANIEAAMHLAARQGLGPWVCARRLGYVR
jgi:soluble lytic murein transglycosylase-like protein